MPSNIETQTIGRIGYLYQLRFQLGDKDIAIEPYSIDEFTITADINRFLPALRVAFTDSQGLLTHVIPLDSATNKAVVTIGRGKDVLEQYNEYEFDIYRRFPNSRGKYDIEGLLSVDNLFSPQYVRSFSGTIRSTLMTIAEELGVDGVELDTSLNYKKSLIQPSWTNAQFLTYLKNNLSGKWDEGCFYAFIRNRVEGGKYGSKTLVFSKLSSLVSEKPRYNFLVGSQSVTYDEYDKSIIYYPVFGYRILDNYKTIGIYGLKSSKYTYFDYDNSEFTWGSIDIQEYPSLTDYFMVDQNDPDTSLDPSTGQSNSFTSDFRGKVLNKYFKDLTDLVKLEIVTWGLEDLCPGDIVKVKFGYPPVVDYTMSLVYQGFWLVERVIHVLGPSYMMKVLLTRNGIDYVRPEGGSDTSLIAASTERRKRG